MNLKHILTRWRERRAQRYYEALLASAADEKFCMMISWKRHATFEDVCVWLTQQEFNLPSFTPSTGKETNP